MSAFAAILRKDLMLELRSGESTIAVLALSLLIMVVIVFALGQAGARGTEAAAGALWIALLFAGIVGASRAALAERENGCIRGLLLSPVDRATIFAAKAAGTFIFMAVAEAASVVLMVLFFNLDFDFRLLRMLPVLVLGLAGFSALATLLAAVAGRTRAGDLILPVLAVPLFVPALIAGVKASSALLAGGEFSMAQAWLNVLAAFDVLFVAAGYLLFEHVASEE
jgi:heme exporter protein B